MDFQKFMISVFFDTPILFLKTLCWSNYFTEFTLSKKAEIDQGEIFHASKTIDMHYIQTNFKSSQ